MLLGLDQEEDAGGAMGIWAIVIEDLQPLELGLLHGALNLCGVIRLVHCLATMGAVQGAIEKVGSPAGEGAKAGAHQGRRVLHFTLTVVDGAATFGIAAQGSAGTSMGLGAIATGLGLLHEMGA